jgi:hypothetical protein
MVCGIAKALGGVISGIDGCDFLQESAKITHTTGMAIL